MTQQLSFLYIPHWYAPARWSEPKPDFPLKSGLVVSGSPTPPPMHGTCTRTSTVTHVTHEPRKSLPSDSIWTRYQGWLVCDGETARQVIWVLLPPCLNNSHGHTPTWLLEHAAASADVVLAYCSTRVQHKPRMDKQMWTQTCLLIMYQLLLQYFTQGSLVFWRQQTQIQHSPRKTGTALSQYKLFTTNSWERIKEMARKGGKWLNVHEYQNGREEGRWKRRRRGPIRHLGYSNQRDRQPVEISMNSVFVTVNIRVSETARAFIRT